MTHLRSFGASAGRLRGRAFGASARHAWLRLLLLVAALGLLAQPAAAQTEIVEYYGHDALGSIRIVFTASGVATARADFEPFGEGVTIAGMPAGPLPAQQFTGQERDALERQDYFGARYYRPRHGRFSQVDPVWGNLFDPQQLNRYAYVGNSPLRHVDPDGRMRLDADCQQLDLTFAKCAAYKAPDSFLAGVFGWQQFLRQGPTFSGGGPGGRRPKGPSEGGDGTDDSGGIDGSGDGNSNTNTNANNTGNNNNANSGQNTGDEGDASSDTSCSSQTRTDALGFSLNLTPLRGGEVGAGLAVQFRPVDVGVYGYFADTWGIGSGLTGVVTYVFGGINNTMKGRGTMAAVNPLLGRFGVAPSTAGRKITAISGGFGPSMGAWASPSVRTATWSVRGTCE